ncbi:MAG: signal peptidase I [Clostridiales bacterium]|nr:signal peptidase I [Clostridiales bacterium]
MENLDLGGAGKKAKDYAKNAKEIAGGEIEFIHSAESVDMQKVGFLRKAVHGAAYLVLVAAVAATVFHYVGFGRVVGESMLPSYTDGERFFVLKLAALDRGDTIVFDYADSVLIKRVIAVGGDTVEVKKGSVYVNGEKLSEDYTQGDTYDMDKITVEEDEIFVMGDNRENSMDSRMFGAVPVDDVIGKVVASW